MFYESVEGVIICPTIDSGAQYSDCICSRQIGNADKPHASADERSGCQYRVGRVHTETAAPCVAIEVLSTQRALSAGITL